MLLSNVLIPKEKEPHCELLQSAALWRVDPQRENEKLPKAIRKQYKCCYFTYDGHCCAHSRLVARVKVPLLMSAVISPCCDLSLAHCSFFSLSRCSVAIAATVHVAQLT